MKPTRILSALLFTASLMALGLGTYKLTEYVRQEAQSDSIYEELAALHDVPSITQASDAALPTNEPIFGAEQTTNTEATVSPDNDAATDAGEELSSSMIAANEGNTSGLAALHALNGDCVAWITIDDTAIDYPVMYRPAQTDYYLHRDFYGKYQFAGTLYIAEICRPFTSDNVIIYGHNMNSGRMFAALLKYKQRSFYEGHSRIRFETLEGMHTYQIIYALTTQVSADSDFAYYRFSDAHSKEEFDAYIASCKARALYDTGFTAEYGDRLLTLSTCEYSHENGRMLVVAKQID